MFWVTAWEWKVQLIIKNDMNQMSFGKLTIRRAY